MVGRPIKECRFCGVTIRGSHGDNWKDELNNVKCEQATQGRHRPSNALTKFQKSSIPKQ